MSPLILLALVVVVESGCLGGLSDTEISGILNVHNTLRHNISDGNFIASGTRMPAASTPIPDLTWDCALEESAQKWADACNFEHSPRDDIGENLYSVSDSNGISLTGTGADASEEWAQEFQKYGWKDVKFTVEVSKSGVGHATQMADAHSTKIGCGIKNCQNGQEAFVVCQYTAPGNMLNSYTYPPKL